MPGHRATEAQVCMTCLSGLALKAPLDDGAPSGLPHVLRLPSSHRAQSTTILPQQTADSAPATPGEEERQFLTKALKVTVSSLVAALPSRKTRKV